MLLLRKRRRAALCM